MSKIRARSVIIEGLVKKGFQDKPGSDHWRCIYFSIDGKKTGVHTKLSRGSQYKDINSNLIAQIAKQCRLSKTDFLNLVDCPLSREDYEQKLKDQQLIK